MWLSVLITLATFVMGYAIWGAWRRNEFSGFAARRQVGGDLPSQAPANAAGPKAGAPAGPAAAGAAAAGPAGAGPAAAVPVAAVPAAATDPAVSNTAQSGIPVALTSVPPAGATAGQQTSYPSQGVGWTRPLDAISRATPQGGIQFIGAVQAPSNRSAFNQAADIIRPAVVNISAFRPGGAAAATVNPNAPSFINPFDGGPDKIIGQMAFHSVGSGVIIDQRGYVITNNHVIAGASVIVVGLFNHPGEYLPAKLVATDLNNDLALLRILADGPFPSAGLADSSQVEVGDWILAVGNPFGLEHTVTAGIVSGKRAAVVIDGVSYSGIIQTDAPINRGSSGGPLVNLQGLMIGLATAIYAPTGVFNGTGFAISSNRVSAFVAAVLPDKAQPQAAAMPVAATGPMLQAPATAAPLPAPPQATGRTPLWLGLGIIDMTPDLASQIKFPFSGGVYVNSIILDSPADEAELTRGDILVAIADRPITDGNTARRILATLEPGKPVNVIVWRRGKTETLKLVPRASLG